MSTHSDELPLVTIVTPSYNQATYLEETIQSVLSQDYPRLEYIIIDGGSTDGSVDIIKKYESRLADWVSEPDAGQSDAINKGWQRAHGEIVAYLNSDDTYTPGAVRISAEYLRQHPNIGMTHGECRWIDASGRPIGLIQADPFTLGELLLQCRIAQPTTFIRKSVLDDVGLLDPSMHLMMDYELWVRIALKYPIACLPGIFANFRIHPTSKTGTSIYHHLREHLEIIRRGFASPHMPRELLPLKPRAEHYAYALTAANAYSLGQFESGRAILDAFFAEQAQPLEYRDDVIRLFANHAVSVASLGYSAETNEDGASSDPVRWLARVMNALPPNAAALRELEPDILTQIHVIQAFGARQKGDWRETRQEIWQAVRRKPELLRQRGIASLFAQSLAKPLRKKVLAQNRLGEMAS